MRRKLWIPLLFVCVTMALPGCVKQGDQSVTTDAKQIQTEDENVHESGQASFSSFSAQDINGQAVGPDLFKKHKLTMVNIWGTYCQPCIKEMPDLGKLNQEFHSQGFQVVGIVLDAQDANGNISQDTVNLAKDIIASTKADYVHLLPGKDLNQIYLSNVAAIPETFFVNSSGEMVGEKIEGSRSLSDWKNIISQMLDN